MNIPSPTAKIDDHRLAVADDGTLWFDPFHPAPDGCDGWVLSSREAEGWIPFAYDGANTLSLRVFAERGDFLAHLSDNANINWPARIADQQAKLVAWQGSNGMGRRAQRRDRDTDGDGFAAGLRSCGGL